jgi:PQQ-like domain
VRLARTGGRSLSSARSLRRPRTLLLALVVLVAGAALIRVGTERLTTSCGESFGRIDGRLVAGRPFARALATGIGVSAADRRDLAASARAVAPGAGVGAPAWAAATKFPLQVVGLGDRIVVRDLGTVGALRASDGRLLWQRRLPHLPALLEPWRDGVAVLSAPEAGDSGAVRVALLDRDGGMLRCTRLRSDVAPDRFHVATTASGLVAVLEGGAKRSRVRLFASGGRQQRWSKTVAGDYASVAIDGPVVVLADRAQAGGGAAVVGLGARDGRQRWTLAARELAGDVPTPTEGVVDRSPRLTRLQGAGRLVIGHAVLHVEDGNELPGRLVALDLRSGRPTWRTRRTVQLRPATPSRSPATSCSWHDGPPRKPSTRWMRARVAGAGEQTLSARATEACSEAASASTSPAADRRSSTPATAASSCSAATRRFPGSAPPGRSPTIGS